MSNVLKDYQANIEVGTGTYTYTVPIAGMYFASMKCSENPTSSVILSIAQTGSASVSVSSPAPAANQSHIELQKVFNCAINDVLTMSISSSNPIDLQLNNVKTLIVLHAGQS